jgi:hypothetical protein
MHKKIYFDNRWTGKNGIGRYSQEIGLRMKSSEIQFIEGNTLIINAKHIPISKTYQDSLFQRLNFL